MHLEWGVVLGVTAAAVVGSLIGGRLAGRVPEAALRKAFALALAAGACLSFVRSCPLRRVITA